MLATNRANWAITACWSTFIEGELSIMINTSTFVRPAGGVASTGLASMVIEASGGCGWSLQPAAATTAAAVMVRGVDRDERSIRIPHGIAFAALRARARSRTWSRCEEGFVQRSFMPG